MNKKEGASCITTHLHFFDCYIKLSLFMVTYLTSSKLNNIDNQTLYYTMVQIW